MRARSILFTFPLLIAPAVLTSCGNSAEEAAERAIENETGGDVEIDSDGGGFQVETDEGSMTVDEDGNMVITDADGNVVMQGDGEGGITNISTPDGVVVMGGGSLPDGWPAPALPDGTTILQASRVEESGTTNWTVLIEYGGDPAAACEAFKATMDGWSKTAEQTIEGDSPMCSLVFEKDGVEWTMYASGTPDGTSSGGVSISAPA
jgi:hypothetical protein